MGDLFDLRGKVAVITGSTKGIGKAMAERMAEHGAKVVISSRKADVCDEVAAAINAKGGEAIAIPCNISDQSQLEVLVNKTVAAWGGIDILVCNAAANPYYGPMADVPEAAYDKTMENNIKRNLWLCNMVLPGMAERGGGSVIIVSSIGGLKGSDNLGIYCISKAADMQLVRNLAVEWGDRGIRANAIAPGLVKTDFARALYEDPERSKRAAAAHALLRLGEPDDIAGIGVYLAAPAGRWTTGQTFVIDGGSTITSRY
ncbi:MAG: short-chain dehydrogenase [Nisaea sp.]|jgi:NAD(P)-dependent dehydrogenase (short-subunit alcohol dehydrogenase family)|nr:short-chain dehydrogenase [Nisaea sp.]OUX91760.1 MAG: short-chain dehydrogenase [Candidatus Endolissoclinum sp. TMED26]